LRGAARCGTTRFRGDPSLARAGGVSFCRLPRPIEQMPVHFSSPRRRRAIIIGGSMSGLFAAAFLRQNGWDADVYERSTVELVGRGAGITTHPELLDALR